MMESNHPPVIPGLVPGIHVFACPPLQPHPEEQRSCVSKEGQESTGASFETDCYAILLRMRAEGDVRD
jgi:hypothetical protein